MASTTNEETNMATEASNTNNNDDDGDNEATHKTVKKMLETKVEGGKSAWATTLETLGMSDGKTKRGDVILTNFDEAMVQFTEMASKKEWEYATTPFEDFGATKEDLLRAFVYWCRKGGKNGDGDDDNGSSSEVVKYNISNAFRRLESYVEWMDKNCQGMDLKGNTMKEIADQWKMKVTHDQKGRLVWWIDFGLVDLKHLKKNVSNDDTLRYFVWLCHFVIFDEGAQKNGLVVAESVGGHGLFETMTAVSMDVGTKLDRLTIGILPIKMEFCYLYNNPGWMRVMMAIMSPFMGKKMRKRIVTIKNKESPQSIFEEAIGKEYIPVGLTNLTGTIEKDLQDDLLEKLT